MSKGASVRFIISLALFGMPSLLLSQTEIYTPYTNLNLWTADTLYLGASFIYTGATATQDGKFSNGFGPPFPITVTVKPKASLWSGELWAIAHDTLGNEETALLFNNGAPSGTRIDLRTRFSFPIAPNSEITFMYKLTDDCGGCWLGRRMNATDQLPKYSGPNRKSDKFRSIASSQNMPNPNWRFGHLWSVAGRTPSGDLEFGFEDGTQDFSDMDFDDMIFTVTNLQLGIYRPKLLMKSFVR